MTAPRPTVARLVMVDFALASCRFSLRERPEKQAWNRYSSLLTGLLDLHQDTVDPSSPAGVWIRHDPQRSEIERTVEQLGIDDPIFAPYRWLQEQERLEGWRSREDARQTVGLMARGLEQCERGSTRAWMNHQGKLLALQMNLFACRLYLTPERAAATLGPKADASTPNVPAHVCIDFRFKEQLGHYWLYATLSVWSSGTSNLALMPDLSTPATEDGPWKVTAIHKEYARLGEAFKERVRQHFPLPEIKILGHEHRPPQFWFAMSPELPVTATTIDNSINTDALNAFADVLLRVPDIRTAGVAAGVIKEWMLMLRRFVPVDRGELPCSLLMPFHELLAQRNAEAREGVWELVWELTYLEASAAAQLFDVVINLEIHTSHLRVYKAVTRQAEEFWNQLALYLPVARGSRVHKLIELVHQTLLQGIADLDQIAILANEEGRKIERAANDLKDQCNHTFTERSPQALSKAPSIRSSLTETGYFDKAARQAGGVRQDAEQVQRSYETLLNGIGRAFDERRVRGTDVLQRVGFALAILVGVFVFLPEVLNAAFSRLDWGPRLVGRR
ncbi:MAG: hypothetical protein ACRDZ4_00920 [Egibacteraceae bacterium]